MTIFEIHKASKEYFDKLVVEKGEWEYFGSLIDCRREYRLDFLDKTFDLFTHIVTKEDLIFGDPNPAWSCEPKNKDKEVAEYKAWQQRKYSFEPLFLGQWPFDEQVGGFRKSDKHGYYYYLPLEHTVQYFLNNHEQLNYEHKLVPTHFKEVTELIK